MKQENQTQGRYTSEYGPNVEQILASGTRVVRGSIPAQVRKELREAVKAGVLGRLPKDGLKPEIFFHPDHKHGAFERQLREAGYAIECISKVVVGGKEYLEGQERQETAIAKGAA